MVQQTALDWYYDKTVVEGKTNYDELLQQAKKMEKEQFIQCAKYSFNAGMKPISDPTHAESFARHFYKQKHGDNS